MIDHNSSLGREVLAFEQARQAALVSGEPASLDAVLHDDLIHIHSSGMAHTKAAFIAHVRKMGGFVAIQRGELELRRAGDAVVITGPTLNTVRRMDTGGVATLDAFGSVVIVKGPKGWQVVLSQITVIKRSTS